MFGSRQSSLTTKSLEALIKRASDETLTGDNWQYILDVCDKIDQDPESNTKEAIRVIGARLTTRDANVVLRTLSLLVATAENCGSRMKQEIATKSFLDALIKKLGDRKLHKQVKSRIAEVIGQLSQSFKLDPSLKPMSDAYRTIETQYPQYLHAANGSSSSQAGVLGAPSKPAKTELSAQEKLKEEEELNRVLQLSLQEYEQQESIRKNYLSSKPLPQTREETLPPQPELAIQKTVETPLAPAAVSNAQDSIATVSKVRALYDLISYEPDELSFRKGDIINVIESVYRDWWRGSLPSGKVGIFPLNYVTPVITKAPEELSREYEIENKILSVDLRKVDKLLALLSSNPSQVDEDEITQLYNEIIPIRPTLAKSIDKYSVRKEELTTLHNQFQTEVKLYNDLVDNLINQRHNSTSYLLPYPNNSRYLTQPESLQQQPTSAGFGNGQSFEAQQTGQNQQSYGVPPSGQNQQNYGPPSQATGQNQSYGVPSQPTGQTQSYRVPSQPTGQNQQSYGAPSPGQNQQNYGQAPPPGQNQSYGQAPQSTGLNPPSYGQPSSQNTGPGPTSFPQYDQGFQRASSQQFLNINSFPDVNNF